MSFKMRTIPQKLSILSALTAAVVLLLPTCGAVPGGDPSINVALRTSFGAAPYLVELLETAALENSSSYFPLLDRIAEGVFADLSTDKEYYDKFIEVLQQDGHLSDLESLSSFKYALSLHAAAPRIQAHFQYYKDSVEPNMMAAQDAVCPVWIQMNGQQYCSPTLERAQQPVDVEDADAVLPFDRVLGSSMDNVHSVLYADITHPLFGHFHETAIRPARDAQMAYRVRYRPSLDQTERPLYVSGYGAELVLKRTDYIVIDDRETVKESSEDGTTDAQKSEKKPDFQPLTMSELSTLGLNTGSYIASSSNPMDTLLEISGNFPKYSAEIAAHNASSDFLDEHEHNRDLFLPAGFNLLLMNGLQIDRRQIDPHLLLGTLKRERRLMGQMKDIGLTAAEAVNLLSYDTLSGSQMDDEPVRYYWPDDEERSPVIMWINDLEKDDRYAGWSNSLSMLLQRTYPGQIPQISRNIHNLVVPFNPGDIDDLHLVVNALQGLIRRGIAIRIGLLPLSSSETGLEVAKISYYLIDTYGIDAVMTFYQRAVQSKKGISGLETSFEETTKDHEILPGETAVSYSEALALEIVEARLATLGEYQNRLGLDDSTVLLNGVTFPRDERWFETASQRLALDNRRLQIGVYQGEISEDTWLPGLFLERSVSRRNVLISPDDLKSINLAAVADLMTDFPQAFDTLPTVAGGDSSLPGDQAHILVLADFDTTNGQDLLREAIKFHDKRLETELLLVHSEDGTAENTDFSTKLYAAITHDHNIKSGILNFLLDADVGDEWKQLYDEAKQFWSSHKDFIAQIGLNVKQRGLWLNGRLVGPILTPFLAEDFATLLEFERKNRIAPVTTAITGLSLEDKFQKPLDLAKITSTVARSMKSDIPEGIYESAPLVRRNDHLKWRGDHTLIRLGSTANPTIQIVAAIDPASEIVQPWIPILKTLSELAGVEVKIYLNPRNRLEELPIKRFYSEVVGSAPSFNENGSLVTLQASFSGIPKETLFNLGMIVPPAWLVAPKESLYDLDNIKLSSVSAGRNVEAVYELEHILIEGHARESASGAPPRGVQLLLGTAENPHFTDTIIMANLGYFQFKANPGYWDISLKPGRSSKIFNIDSVGAKGYSATPGDETTSVALLSFQGATLYPRLSRKSGMETEDVLETTGKGGAVDYLGKGASFAQSALSSLGFKKKSTSTNADINIFSVASGHLYERMLNIMMVSVMKHTKHTVKFWFIEQFLSPSFKASLPDLASHYKFSYEMVTYKWPHWLRGQKEKQREIWGYKILFLDVLFPLDLDKVIFVDADQVVRTDMMELNNVDLQGAPYGFTPMCDSRTEMEGFRFWKQGYWENYLDGKPYHISALYVVDLKKFREVAAGDRLRGQYHSLSADPGSLSNLDQDLPNHMQHVLRIHSLDQDWLWCETWCSDEALTTAKTIDLCNNPQTKEPKLDRARRQLPEWTVYDDEIAQVLRKARGGRDTYEDVQEQEQRDAAKKGEKGGVAGEGEEEIESKKKDPTLGQDPRKRDEL